MTVEHHTPASPLAGLDGTGRDDRLKGLPAPPHLAVDGMDLLRRLAMAAGFAEQVAFIGADNAPSGNWRGLFTSDASMLLALLASHPLEAEEKRMRPFSRRCRGEAGWEVVEQIVRMASLLNGWYLSLLSCRGEAPFGLVRTLSGIIHGRLGEALARLQLAEIRLGRELIHKEPLVDLGAFHRIWNLKEHAVTVLNHSEGGDGVDPALFYPFYNAALHIREEARQRFSHSLATGDHDPAAGLFIAFLSLYQRAADRMNAMPGRHCDLYYDEILGFSRLPPRPGGLYLALFADGTRPVTPVSADTLFWGGKEALGRDVACRTRHSLSVHHGRVAMAETLFFERHPLISPECELGLVSAVRHASHTLEDPETVDSLSGQVGWSLFGAPHALTDEEEGRAATLGFAVAAPLLLLAEGERRIEMVLDVQPLVAEMAALFERTLETLEKSRKEGREGALRLLFGTAFLLSLSVEAGWYPVSDVTLSFGIPSKGPRLTFQVGLGREVPAVVPCTAEIHGPNHLGDPGLPVLRVMLNPRAPVNLYSLLSGFRLRQIALRATVIGARQVSLVNNLGPLDPNTPFAPFGPLPKCGSFLILGHRESAGKEVKTLAVKLSWSELPTTSGGFAEHYRAYEKSVDNASFAATLSVLKEGQWVEESGRAEHTLFGEDPGPGDRPASAGRLLWRSETFPCIASMGEVDDRYGPGARNGFYRVQLSAPEMAFGHLLYPERLTRGLMTQATVKKCVELPNAPYTPMIDRVSLDYEATETLDFTTRKGAGRFYHLYPSGFDRLDDREEGEAIPLIPSMDGDGHLFLGVAGERLSGTVNLLFCLQGDGVHIVRPPLFEVRWAFLRGNRWHPLSDKSLLHDGTRGFLTSGLVVLALPDALTCDHTLMPPGFFWLRATPIIPGGDPKTLQKVMASLSRCRAVVLNGLFARLDDDTSMEETLPGGCLHRPAAPLPGVGSVRQFMDAFGGRREESSDERMARIGERLRHKGRAVTPWDVERTLLAHVPGARKVKCFPGMSLGKAYHPGRFVVVVLPERQGQATTPPQFTTLQLEEMATHLRGRLSDHALFEVVNPVYEKIQVRCTLTLAKGHGDALKRVHDAISDFLSPWAEGTGYRPRFGWCVRESEVEAHIAAHPDVVAVTNVSMLHITRSADGEFAMADTVIADGGGADEEEPYPCDPVAEERGSITKKEIHPTTPWSIAIPADAHFLETTLVRKFITPQRTGIGELEIGRTFIV